MICVQLILNKKNYFFLFQVNILILLDLPGTKRNNFFYLKLTVHRS